VNIEEWACIKPIEPNSAYFPSPSRLGWLLKLSPGFFWIGCVSEVLFWWIFGFG
jgi:hypothetical protein